MAGESIYVREVPQVVWLASLILRIGLILPPSCAIITSHQLLSRRSCISLSVIMSEPIERIRQSLLFSSTTQLTASVLAQEEDVHIDDNAEFDLGDYDEDYAPNLADILLMTAAQASVAAAMLPDSESLNDSSRGPYNQYDKCWEFFDKAMRWPDRDFRHQFRCASTISRYNIASHCRHSEWAARHSTSLSRNSKQTQSSILCAGLQDRWACVEGTWPLLSVYSRRLIESSSNPCGIICH